MLVMMGMSSFGIVMYKEGLGGVEKEKRENWMG